MAKRSFKHGWWRLFNFKPKRQSAGFTLIELLVAMLIGSLIVTGLLYLVVELTQKNQAESARAETQRDMQLALDYISADLREAAFVYDKDCLVQQGVATDANFCPGLLKEGIPATVVSAGNVIPILFFWRIDPLPQALINRCKLAAPPATVPCVSRRSYTLVGYFLDRTNPTNTWGGRARITRYQLAQFQENDTTGTVAAGYVSPQVTGFLQWPYGTNATTGNFEDLQGATVPAGGPVTLVDFVDDGEPDQANPLPAPTAARPFCPNGYVSSTDENLLVGTKPLYQVKSFYACVANGGRAGVQGVNQEVQLYLRGNIAGRPGFPLQTTRINTQASMPPLETRVLIRGVLGKSPQE